MSGNETITFVQLLRKQGKQTGDTVHIKRKPHYIYEIREDSMTFVSMDERKVFVTLWDKQPCTKTN
jgi:hypothetical protein